MSIAIFIQKVLKEKDEVELYLHEIKSELDGAFKNHNINYLIQYNIDSDFNIIYNFSIYYNKFHTKIEYDLFTIENNKNGEFILTINLPKSNKKIINSFEELKNNIQSEFNNNKEWINLFKILINYV